METVVDKNRFIKILQNPVFVGDRTPFSTSEKHVKVTNKNIEKMDGQDVVVDNKFFNDPNKIMFLMAIIIALLFLVE